MTKFDSKKRGAYRAKARGASPCDGKIKTIRKNEFRENISISPPHTAHIYGQQGNDYLYHNITHSPMSKRGDKYVPLPENPNKKPKLSDCGRQPYFNPVPGKKHKRFFSKKEKKVYQIKIHSIFNEHSLQCREC